MTAATRFIIADYLRKLAETKITKTEASRQTGIARLTILRYERDFGIRFVAGRGGPRKAGGPFVSGGSIQEACVANRDNYSAAEIGAILGITRNAVIGHWYRARKQGLIT
jgi:hypothetical protein